MSALPVGGRQDQVCRGRALEDGRVSRETPPVSVILPCYNEAGNIVPLIRSIRRQLGRSCEILVMDDQSPDGTAEAARQAFADDPAVIVQLRTQQRGFASSIRDGIERSRGELIIVMDTDFNHDPALLEELLRLSPHAEMVIASRFCPGGGMERKGYFVASRLYNQFLRAVLGTCVDDNLFGYFVIRRELLLGLPFDDIFYGYGDYFFRLLWHVRRRAGRIIETPSFCKARLSGTSKSSVVSMLTRYTIEAVKLRTRS